MSVETNNISDGCSYHQWPWTHNNNDKSWIYNHFDLMVIMLGGQKIKSGTITIPIAIIELINVEIITPY